MPKKPPVETKGGKVRSAVTGRYVKGEQAKRSPRETVTERDKPKRGPKKKS